MAEPNPTAPILDSETIARFWSKVNKNGPEHPTRPELGRCWLWMAGTFRDGYGQFKVAGRNLKAHRVARFLATGEWATQLVCHSCDRPGCMRDSHLFVGTPADNLGDCKAKGRLNTASGEKHRTHTHPELVLRGEHVGGAVLTKSQVIEICSLYLTGQFTQQQLADRFGVKRETLSQIFRGNNWQHLPVDWASIANISKTNRYRGRPKST